jgi:hypothetical protein
MRNRIQTDEQRHPIYPLDPRGLPGGWVLHSVVPDVFKRGLVSLGATIGGVAGCVGGGGSGAALGFCLGVRREQPSGTFWVWGLELWAGGSEAGLPPGRSSASWKTKSAVKTSKITQEISMSAFAKMFEEGVKQALKLWQDPAARKGLTEAAAKSAEMVLKAAKVVAKQAAKARR